MPARNDFRKAIARVKKPGDDTVSTAGADKPFKPAKKREPLYGWMGNYGIDLEMTMAQAESVSGRGDQEQNVRRLMKEPDIKRQLDKIDKEALKKELREYGAWEDDELEDHQENLLRLVWLAGGAIKENPEDYKLDD